MKKYSIFSLLIITNLAMHAMYQQGRGANTYPLYQQNIPGNQAPRPIDRRYLTIDPKATQITPVQQQMPQRPADINKAARGFFVMMRTQLEAMIQEPELSNDNKELARRIIEILPETAQENKQGNYISESPTTSSR